MSIQVLRAREVPLGGPRALMVRRTLPHRDRSFIGAWCFVDHYGPTPVDRDTGMDLPPHPHTGLQTVSWLFEGEIEHRDSGGAHGPVRPGEVNLMTAGHGIAHSEVSTPGTTVLHGVQLWLALPSPACDDAARDFEHYAPQPVEVAAERGHAQALVFLGPLAGVTSPVATYTPLLGAELTMSPGAVLASTSTLTSSTGSCSTPGASRWTAYRSSTATWPARTPALGSCACRQGSRGRASCCSAARRSRKRSSCGGTSSGAATRTSTRPANSGRSAANGSGRSRGMPGGSRGCQRPSCRTYGCSLAGASEAPGEPPQRGT